MPHPKSALRLAAVAIFLLLALAYFSLGWNEVLTLETLQQQRGNLQAQVQAQPLLSAAIYFALYVAVCAVSFPGAGVLTLAGGALFGFGWGLLIVSFASSIGAVLAFLSARFLLRDWVEARFAQRLQALHAGLEKDGAFYLLTLRLVPLVPFFLVNLAFGLSRLPTRTFYITSQWGMLPGTAVFVNAGVQLSRIDSLSGIASFPVLASLALLGLFPWLARLGLDGYKRRRLLAPWRSQQPRRFDRNLVVIGAGAGGLVTAYIAAAVKAKVTLVEAHTMGGDCLNYGCVPSKALIKSAKVAHQMRHASRYGLTDTEPVIPFKNVMNRINAAVRKIAPNDSIERYTALGVDVVPGYARITNPWTVEITLTGGGTRQLTTRSIVIAAGAQPIVPDIPGMKEAGFLTSDTLWAALSTLDKLPERIVLLGGGPIGCEIAQSLARLGAAVTLIESAPRLLVREDDAVSNHAREALTADGVAVMTGHTAVRCSATLVKTLSTVCAGVEHHFAYDLLICAVGRQARLVGYGLETLGIATHRTVDVNAYLQTQFPHIYAVGDAAGPYQYTHMAAHQAWYGAVNALFGSRFKRFKVDYRLVPSVTFLDPEIARVGLNQREAQAQGITFESTRYDLGELDRAVTEGEAHGFVQVLTVPGKDKILGVTIVGSHAGELLAEWVLAMKHGIGLNKILGTVHAYPTWSESSKAVAGAWKRNHQPERLLRWVGRFHAWRRG